MGIDRPDPKAVERALKLQAGSVLAREVLALREENYDLGQELAEQLIHHERRTQALRAELEQRRATVTTGGPGVPFTEGWERGPSSRPSTAPPEDEEVQLP